MTNSLVMLKSGDSIPKMLEFLRGKSEKVCIASMSHSYEFLKSKLAEKGVPAGNIRFIDCISKSLFMGVEDKEDCSFIRVHMAMKDFVVELSSKLVVMEGLRIFIFDSLSDLKKYWAQAGDIVNFSKSLFPVLSELGADSYFMIMEEDKEKCTGEVVSAFDGAFSGFDRSKKI